MPQILKLESKKILKGDLKGHINSVAFSPDGKYVVSGCSDTTLRIWEVESGQEMHILEGHIDGVRSVAFSPDGKYVVSGSYDTTVRIWDVATETETKNLKGHTDWINSVAFSPDGINVASGSLDKTGRIWEVESGQEMHILEGHSSSVTSVAFSPNGQYMVSATDKTARIWEVDFGMVENKLEGHSDINSVAFSPDGKYVVSGSEDKTARIWDVATETETKKLKGHSNVVRSVAFSPDGKYVVSGSLDKTVRIWDVRSGKEIYKLKMNSPIVTVAFSPNITSGYTLAFTGDSTIHLYDLKQKNISPFHASLVKSPSIESISMPSIGDNFIDGEEPLSEYEYDIEDLDFPILFTDMKFPLKVMMKSRLEKLLQDNEAIFYKCKKETATTSLGIYPKDVHPQPYMKTTVFGLETVGDALIKIENIQNILKDSKKIRLKDRQKQAIRKLGEESSMKEANMTPQSNMINKVNSVLKIEKIPPRIYTFVPTKTEIKRVASKAVLERMGVVSRKHCQDQIKMTVYTLKQVSKKRTKKRKYREKKASISRKNNSL